MTNLDLHGNRGLIWEEPGTIITDIYGLETCTAVAKCPMDSFGSVPGMRSGHPIYSYLYMEKRSVAITPGFLVITCDYAGIPGGRTDSVFEMSMGMAEEPIETHPKFVTEIAGKPSAPLNGAVFVNLAGEPSKVDEGDESVGLFKEFKVIWQGQKNPLAGVASYLSPQATYRETWMATSPPDLGSLGKISQPFGGALPSLNGGNWLFVGASFQQRGIVFANSREWRSTIAPGWNQILYGT